MELLGFPTPDDMPSFPSWDQFYDYIKSFAKHFDVSQHIKVCLYLYCNNNADVSALLIEVGPGRYWTVTYSVLAVQNINTKISTCRTLSHSKIFRRLVLTI